MATFNGNHPDEKISRYPEEKVFIRIIYLSGPHVLLDYILLSFSSVSRHNILYLSGL